MNDGHQAAVLLAVDTPAQRDELTAACAAILDGEERELKTCDQPGGDESHLALAQAWVADAEELRDRLDAGGSVCLVPGHMVEAVYEHLTDSATDELGLAGDAEPDDRRAHLNRAASTTALLITLGDGLATTA